MNTQNLHANIRLDMRGLTCPAPLLGAKRVVDDLKNEQVLLLISDCPGTGTTCSPWRTDTQQRIGDRSDADGGTGYCIMKGKGVTYKANVILIFAVLSARGQLLRPKTAERHEHRRDPRLSAIARGYDQTSSAASMTSVKIPTPSKYPQASMNFFCKA